MNNLMNIKSKCFYKNLMSFVLSCILICMSFSSAFYTVSATALANGNDNNISWVLTDDGCCTFSGTGTIASTLGYSEYKEQIKKVVVSEGITKIGVGAFDSYKSLEAVILPDGFESIGGYAFISCSALKEINLPDTVTNISNFAFSGCSSLEEIELPPNLGEKALFSVFNGTAIKEISVPEGVKVLGDDAFNNCKNLKKIILPATLEEIGPAAFDGCSALTEITIPEKVTVIQPLTFRGCSSLKKIHMPSGIKELRHYAVNSCTSLESITLPSTVTRIEEHNFDTCTSLKKINYLGTKAQWSEIEIVENGNRCLSESVEIVCSDGVFQPSGKPVETEFVTITVGYTVEELLADMPVGSNITDKYDYAVYDTAMAATGMRVTYPDGKTALIVCLGDTDGDGKVSAADARLALRASVGLENLSSAQSAAADVDMPEENKVTAADARKILRVSVGLEDMQEVLNALK